VAIPVADYKVVVRPNCSLSSRGMMLVVAIIATFSLLIGISFTLIGAWLILPFAGLEVLAVAYAFYYIHCHSGDYESITIEGDTVSIEKRDYKYDSRTVFNRYWARIFLRDLPCGDQSLFVRSHGKEIEFGRHFMNNDQRLLLAEQLKQRVGVIT
jgi:uncharacterized membrane protein